MAQISIVVNERGIDPADRKLKKLGQTGSKTEKQVQSIGTSFEKFGKSANDSIALVDGPLGGLASRVTALTGLIGGGAAGLVGATAALTAGMYALASSQSAVVTEMDNMSRVAGLNINDYRELAFAAAQYGLTVDQLGDAFKDTRERIGDFIATGGGPLQDFGDVMGYTKEQTLEFAKSVEGLSGQEVLVRMVSRLEDAGKSTEQMSFALEGMANDMTKLLPLLSDGGREIDNLKRQMDAVTNPLTEEDVQRYREFKKSVDLVAGSFNSFVTKEIVPLLDGFTRLNNQVSTFIASLSEGSEAALNDELSELLERQRELEEALDNTGSAFGRLKNVANFESTVPRDLTNEMERVEAQIDEVIGKLRVISGTPANVLETPIPAIVGTGESPVASTSKTVGESDIEAKSQKKLDAISREQDAIRKLYMTETELANASLQADLDRISKAGFADEERRALEIEAQFAHTQALMEIQQSGIDAELAAKKAASDQYMEMMRAENEGLVMMIESSSAALSSSITSGVTGLIDGSKDVKDVVLGTVQSVANSVIKAGLEILIQKQITDKIAGSMLVGQTAMDVSRGVSMASLNAFAATAAIPVVGPAMAPAAAASAASAAAALGAPAIASASARFQGGSVNAGQSYLWQERGGEVFVPKQDGRILSANDIAMARSGGGQGVTVVNNIYNQTDARVTSRPNDQGGEDIYITRDEFPDAVAALLGNPDSDANRAQSSVFKMERT